MIDVTGTVQGGIIVKNIDSELNISEEMAFLVSLKDYKTS